MNKFIKLLKKSFILIKYHRIIQCIPLITPPNIFVIYFIPGIPKDILVYVAGISNVTLRDFILYSSAGRLPWIITSAMFGHGIHRGDYVSMIIIGVVSGALFLVGILKGHSIIDFFHRVLKHEGKNKRK